MCIESLGRCGAETLQRPSLSSWAAEWHPMPRLPSAVFRSYKPRCYVIEIPNYGQIQDDLLSVDVGDVRYPFGDHRVFLVPELPKDALNSMNPVCRSAVKAFRSL